MSVSAISALSPAALLGGVEASSTNRSRTGANAALSSTGLKPAAASSTSGSSSSSSSSTSSSTTDIGTTFLNLLVQELQNQDPTAPMDSTAMVGQMISLNQLDQLIAINQAVNPTSSTASTSAVSSARVGKRHCECQLGCHACCPLGSAGRCASLAQFPWQHRLAPVPPPVLPLPATRPLSIFPNFQSHVRG